MNNKQTKICSFMSLFRDKQIKELEEYFNELPHKVAKSYMDHFHKSFDNEGFTDDKLDKWSKRSKKDKNKKKRNLLVNKGRLRRSLKKKVKGRRVTIYTKTPYAEIHNEGGTINATVKVKSYKRKGRKKKVSTVKAHTRNMSTKIPKRQFMGESRQVTKGLEKEIENTFKTIFKFK